MLNSINYHNITKLFSSEIYSLQPLPCQLLDDFGIFLQLFFAFGAFSFLIFKKIIEKSDRDWKTWALDVSKQAISSTFSHFINLAISENYGKEYMNQCNWYFILLILDTLLGTFLNIMIFKQIEFFCSDFDEIRFTCGQYSKENTGKNWLFQTFMWSCLTIIVKMFLFSIVFMNFEFFSFLTNWVLAPFQINPHIELFYIMVFLPTVFNAIAFWVTDNYLQKENSISFENCEDSDNLIKKSPGSRLRKLMTT